jgi:DNA-binding transcriptional MocR family regulator
VSITWSGTFARRIGALKPSAIRAMARHVGQPGVTSFAAGSPNAELFPVQDIAQAVAAILADPVQARQALQYGASEGYMPLRQFIAELLSQGDAIVAPAEVIVTSGSQQALEFIGKTFIDAGDRVIVTRPTYSGALQAFGLFEPVFANVDLTDDGLDLAGLEAEFRKGAKFFYAMPDHGNPSGSTLPLEQRHEVIALARQYGIPVVEDQAYDQLQLSGEKQPTLLALDRSTAAGKPIVLYLGTFSKSLTPGLRVGWIIAPEAVLAKLVSIKQASDLNSGMLNQMVVNAVARRILKSHGPVLRTGYRLRRDAMLAALSRYMPNSVRWQEPEGGMFVWLTLPPDLDASRLQEVAFEQAKIIFVPGYAFHADGSGANTLRLSYSIAGAAEITDGIRRLAGVIEGMRK